MTLNLGKWAVILAALWLVGARGTANGAEADPAAAKAPPDTSKVFVVVEVPPVAPAETKSEFEKAFMKKGHGGGFPFGGLTAIFPKDPADADTEASASSVGGLLHVKVVGRAAVKVPTTPKTYKLTVSYTLSTPEADKWKQVYAGTLTVTGWLEHRDYVGGGSKDVLANDLDLMADVLAQVVIARLFPYRIDEARLDTGYVNGSPLMVKLTMKNTSPHMITEVCIRSPDIRQIDTHVSNSLQIAPGEVKQIKILVGDGSPSEWRQALVSDLKFQKGGAGGGPRGGR